MKVADLIDRLSKLDRNDVVKIYDADTGGFAPVTGMLYGGGDKIVTLQSDDNDACDHPACWGPCGTCGAHVHENAIGRFCPNCGKV